MYFQTLVYNQILFASLPLSLRTLAVTGFRHVINLPVCVHVLCVVDVRIGPITIFCCCCCFVRKYWIVICAYLFMILPEICSSRKHTRTAHIFSADSIKPIISIIFFLLLLLLCVYYLADMTMILTICDMRGIDGFRIEWWQWGFVACHCGTALRFACDACCMYVAYVCVGIGAPAIKITVSQRWSLPEILPCMRALGIWWLTTIRADAHSICVSASISIYTFCCSFLLMATKKCICFAAASVATLMSLSLQ